MKKRVRRGKAIRRSIKRVKGLSPHMQGLKEHYIWDESDPKSLSEKKIAYEG